VLGKPRRGQWRKPGSSAVFFCRLAGSLGCKNAEKRNFGFVCQYFAKISGFPELLT
jgi:hypothetical protein